MEALEILKVEEDKPTSKFPENYSELVASGFKQFEYDLGQITAGQDVGYTKSPNQRKIIKRLKVIASKPQNENNNQIQKQISLLIEGYNLKLSAGLTKELTGIIQNDYDDDKFLDKLNIFYNLYKLHKVSENVEDPWLEKPRILYSKYYFEKN